MRTRTPTEVTRVSVEPTASGIRARSGGGVFRSMLLGRNGNRVRIALVPDRALLLADDRVRIEITVGGGVELELVETTGTVAYDMRGAGATWAADVSVEAGGACRWAGLPFVVAAGARVERSLDVALRGDARFQLRETLVLGRHGESAGQVRNLSRVTRDGSPVLVEEIDQHALAHHRVMDTVVSLGVAPATPDVAPPAAVQLDLAGGGTCWRSLGQEAHRTAAELGPVWRALTGG